MIPGIPQFQPRKRPRLTGHHREAAKLGLYAAAVEGAHRAMDDYQNEMDYKVNFLGYSRSMGDPDLSRLEDEGEERHKAYRDAAAKATRRALLEHWDQVKKFSAANPSDSVRYLSHHIAASPALDSSDLDEFVNDEDPITRASVLENPKATDSQKASVRAQADAMRATRGDNGGDKGPFGPLGG